MAKKKRQGSTRSAKTKKAARRPVTRTAAKRKPTSRPSRKKPAKRKPASRKPAKRILATRRPAKRTPTKRAKAIETHAAAPPATMPPPAAVTETPTGDLFVATAAGCLDQEVAMSLVFSCIPNGAVPLGTQLGTLFGGDVPRRGFCGCVFRKATAAGSTVAPGDVPCAPTTTVGDVIDALSC